MSVGGEEKVHPLAAIDKYSSCQVSGKYES